MLPSFDTLDRRRSLASVLLALLLAAPQCACFILEDYPVLEPLPAKRNASARIVRVNSPPQRESTVRPRACGGLDFSVTVHDEDLSGTTVRSLWFLDPLPGYATGEFRGETVGGGTRQLSAPARLLERLETLTDGQKHRVEVWITDGEFVPGGVEVVPPVSESAANAASETYLADSALWFVEVQPCPE